MLRKTNRKKYLRLRGKIFAQHGAEKISAHRAIKTAPGKM
jgi:hypothetical protein